MTRFVLIFSFLGFAGCLLGCGQELPKGYAPPKKPVAQTETPVKTGSEKAAVPAVAETPTDPPAVDDKTGLPHYKKSTDAVAGTIKSKGSDTMATLMTYWVEGFKSFYPGITAEIAHNGSGDAPKALIDDLATFGAMSRDWEPGEVDKFEAAHKFKPTVVPTCIDMLAVYVHKDNPISGLTLQQVDAIFSKERKGGFPKDIKTWGDLGLTGDWADKPIELYGRNSTSGTYKYFKDHAMFKGSYKETYKEQAGSSAVIGTIASNKYAIGYSGIGYASAGVKIVPLAVKDGMPFVAAEPKNAYSEEYPLARYLFVSFKHQPGTPLDPLRREFLRYVLSSEGQAMVKKDQYVPLAPEMVRDTLKEFGLSPK
ncbi:MAG: PstS family phosphate ABC transporter substrate-binding protein [Pirellulales bacterium]